MIHWVYFYIMELHANILNFLIMVYLTHCRSLTIIIQTIIWGFDTLSNFAHLLKPLEDTIYNPIYNQLYVIKAGNITFRYNDCLQYYVGSDSIQFHRKFSKLVFLMLWLASPTNRPYLPLPNDSLLLQWFFHQPTMHSSRYVVVVR